MVKGAQGQAIVESKARTRAVRWIAGEGRKKNGVQMAGGQDSIDGIRRQNKDRTGAELSAGRHERQVEVKVDA